MSVSRGPGKEGSLDAPSRHPIDWRNPAFYDQAAVEKELERVFDICHGCRRCFSLCQAFPTLFDLVDATTSGEVSDVPKRDYGAVVDHCYLCDLCFMTKCPYVPPHEWAVDFPHLMLRAKAHKHRKHGATLGERILASPQAVGRIAGVPVVAEIVNAVNGSKLGRKVLDAALGVDGSAPLPRYHGVSARQQLARRKRPAIVPVATPRTSGRVALFTTCYGNHNMPDLATDLCAVFEHNGVTVDLAAREQCCGMPRMELGDLDTVAKYKEVNIPELKGLIAQGFDIVAPIPSCVLMFKQELPLLFPEDPDVQAVSKRIFDPFEYLWLRHEAGLLRTDFQQSLGKISYHAPCHLRVQNIGYKTRDILQLVPETRIELIERCSGHDGTYGVKKKFRAASMKIAKPVIDRVAAAGANSYSSDCPMAGAQIGSGLSDGRAPEHPLLLLRRAYGL